MRTDPAQKLMLRLTPKKPVCLRKPARDHRLAAFLREDDGSFVSFGLFVFLLMFLIGGLAVDVMNAEHRRVHLQNTLDNAVLASANLQQTQEPKLVIEDYFRTSGLEDSLKPLDASAYSVLTDQRKVDGTAGNDVPTFFMRMIGVDTFPAVALAAAEEMLGSTTPENREVSLVIDISGSMRDNGRIEELRDASKDLVDVLLTGDAATTTSINVIPYAGQVNPGPEMFELLGGIQYGTTGGHMYTEHDTFTNSTKDISNVVFYYDNGTGGANGYDYTSRIEGYPDNDVALFDKDDLDSYVYFADAYLKRHAPGLIKNAVLKGVAWKAGNEVNLTKLNGGDFAPIDTAKGKDQGTVDFEVQFGAFYSSVIAQFSSCIYYASDDFAHTGLPDNGYYHQVPHFMNWPIDAATMDWGWCPEDDSAIQYAQNDKAALHAFIDSLRLHDGGGVHHGLKYALALLDPTSNDEFIELSLKGLVPTQFDDRPAAWSEETTAKYIVLMSQGLVEKEVTPVNPLNPMNETVALLDQSGSASTTYTTGETNVADFYALCNMAKQNDVEIFTIAFEASETGKQQLLNCASSPSHHFEVDGADLSSIFSNVSGAITQLRLTK